mmetsp:Transcript_26504/g.67395  ORF Transcript_26504/g.67395 Transcript_26504/m.67395 type:complete len:253 (+) Transcript_26504:2654-3412(+)
MAAARAVEAASRRIMASSAVRSRPKPPRPGLPDPAPPAVLPIGDHGSAGGVLWLAGAGTGAGTPAYAEMGMLTNDSRASTDALLAATGCEDACAGCIPSPLDGMAGSATGCDAAESCTCSARALLWPLPVVRGDAAAALSAVAAGCHSIVLATLPDAPSQLSFAACLASAGECVPSCSHTAATSSASSLALASASTVCMAAATTCDAAAAAAASACARSRAAAACAAAAASSACFFSHTATHSRWRLMTSCS